MTRLYIDDTYLSINNVNTYTNGNKQSISNAVKMSFFDGLTSSAIAWSTRNTVYSLEIVFNFPLKLNFINIFDFNNQYGYYLRTEGVLENGTVTTLSASSVDPRKIEIDPNVKYSKIIFYYQIGSTNYGSVGIKEVIIDFDPIFMSIIRSNDKYYTYKNNEFIEIEPTIENFINENIDLQLLITPTDKITLTMDNKGIIEDGNIYEIFIDTSKYKNIEKMGVK